MQTVFYIAVTLQYTMLKNGKMLTTEISNGNMNSVFMAYKVSFNLAKILSEVHDIHQTSIGPFSTTDIYICDAQVCLDHYNNLLIDVHTHYASLILGFCSEMI